MSDIFDTPGIVVAKVGSSTLVGPDGGIDRARVDSLAAQLASLADEGMLPILVSSGAVAAGFGQLGLAERPQDMPTLQACASAGQTALMQAYSQAFGSHGRAVGQVLLTRRDLADRQGYLNARSTLGRLLELGAVPIVNENDTVSVAEFAFGDNDMLGAIVATIVNASLYVILSDIDGLYTANPSEDPDARLVPHLEGIGPAVEAMAGGSGSALGTGGMRTKLRAGHIALAARVPLVICRGSRPGALVDAVHGRGPQTRIDPDPRGHYEGARKLWLITSERPKGAIVVDDGAARAVLEDGASVLPVGVRQVEGSFQEQDLVDVRTLDGRTIGRGVARYGAEDLRRCQGLRLDVIGRFSPEKAHCPAVHRDDLVVF